METCLPPSVCLVCVCFISRGGAQPGGMIGAPDPHSPSTPAHKFCQKVHSSIVLTYLTLEKTKLVFSASVFVAIWTHLLILFFSSTVVPGAFVFSCSASASNQASGAYQDNRACGYFSLWINSLKTGALCRFCGSVSTIMSQWGVIYGGWDVQNTFTIKKNTFTIKKAH